jgi:hypothetical protein
MMPAMFMSAERERTAGRDQTPPLDCSSQREQWHRHCLRDGAHAPVLGCKPKVETPATQELDRGQMQRVERAHGLRKRLERAFENQWRQLDE